MMNIFREVRILRQDGMLHRKLIFRTRLLFAISFILSGVLTYHVLFRGADVPMVLLFAGIGFILGLYVFSRMNVVNWNEQEEVLEAGRMDMIGYVSLGLYIAMEIGFRTFLKDFYPASATVFLFAGISGTLFGRGVGTVVTIHRVFTKTQSV